MVEYSKQSFFNWNWAIPREQFHREPEIQREVWYLNARFECLPACFLQVTDAERRLRAALLLDGLKAVDGYKLARYNDPFTPPFLRRNEVLIKLEDYQLEQPKSIEDDV